MKINGIPCCMYPTTILMVDDDEDFLTVLEDSIDLPYKAFESPYDAVKYLSKATFSSFEKTCLSDEYTYDPNERNIKVDIVKLHKQIYNAKRFEEVSIVIVDYQMPGLNGLEFCKSIRNYDVEIIMLTGEASVTLAVDAFNNGIIDKFIRKDTFDLEAEVLKAVNEMQFKHFQQTSHFVIDSLVKGIEILPSFLQNENLVGFFRDILSKNNIEEYYILNNIGDFVFVDKSDRILYFMIRDEASLAEIIKDASAKYKEEPDEAAEKILMAIQKKEQIPFLYNLPHEAADFNSWHKYMHPLKSDVCDGVTYYYALIKEDHHNRGIDTSKIEFLKKS